MKSLTRWLIDCMANWDPICILEMCFVVRRREEKRAISWWWWWWWWFCISPRSNLPFWQGKHACFRLKIAHFTYYQVDRVFLAGFAGTSGWLSRHLALHSVAWPFLPGLEGLLGILGSRGQLSGWNRGLLSSQVSCHCRLRWWYGEGNLEFLELSTWRQEYDTGFGRCPFLRRRVLWRSPERRHQWLKALFPPNRLVTN